MRLYFQYMHILRHSIDVIDAKISKVGQKPSMKILNDGIDKLKIINHKDFKIQRQKLVLEAFKVEEEPNISVRLASVRMTLQTQARCIWTID